MSCRGKGIAKKLECYAHRTATKMKSGIMWVGKQSGRQGTKHQYGWGLFLLGVVGLSVLVGSIFFYQGLIIRNPTIGDVSANVAWKYSNGTSIPNNGVVSGVATCEVQPSLSAVPTSGQITGTSPTGNTVGPYTNVIPYYIVAVSISLYSGTATSGTPKVTLDGTCSDSSYPSKMDAWAKTWAAAGWAVVPPSTPPSNNPKWSFTLNTYNLANGAYTAVVKVSWITSMQWTLSSGYVQTLTFSSPSGTTSGNAFLSTMILSIGVPSETMQVNISHSSTVGTPPLTIHFSASISNGEEPYTYSWDFGDNSTSSSIASPTHVFVAYGTYEVTLTVTDTTGTYATAQTTVTIGPIEPVIGVFLFLGIVGAMAVIIIVKRRG